MRRHSTSKITFQIKYFADYNIRIIFSFPCNPSLYGHFPDIIFCSLSPTYLLFPIQSRLVRSLSRYNIYLLFIFSFPCNPDLYAHCPDIRCELSSLSSHVHICATQACRAVTSFSGFATGGHFSGWLPIARVGSQVS